MKINLLTYDRLTIIKNAFLKSYVDIYSFIDAAKKDIETVFFIRYMANDYEITFKDISLTELNLIYGKGSSIEFVDTLCPNTKNNLLFRTKPHRDIERDNWKFRKVGKENIGSIAIGLKRRFN